MNSRKKISYNEFNFTVSLLAVDRLSLPQEEGSQ